MSGPAKVFELPMLKLGLGAINALLVRAHFLLPPEIARLGGYVNPPPASAPAEPIIASNRARN
jgi:hypothetical protein